MMNIWTLVLKKLNLYAINPYGITLIPPPTQVPNPVEETTF